MSDLHDCKKLAELIYAQLTQIDGVGQFLDSMDEAMTEAVLDDITETLAIYGNTLMTQQQAEPQRVTMAHMDALHKAIDYVASLQNDRLRYKSACEISGEKHPEYVRGYEAAMDTVCKARQQAEPVEYQFYDPATDRWHGFMNERHRIATEEAGYKIRALYTAPQAQTAPIPTAERLPTEADADCDGRVFVWMHASRGKCWLMTHWLNARHGDYWLPIGLKMPPAPGGSDD